MLEAVAVYVKVVGLIAPTKLNVTVWPTLIT